MGSALELLTGFVTAPGTTLTALTMAAGNTLTVRNAPIDTDIRLLQCWADNQGAGTLRIRGPEFHDNVQGIRLDVTVSDVKPLLPWGYFEKLRPQQDITVELSGSATAGDIETACLLVYYAELPGVEARFTTPEDVKGRMTHLVTVENTLSLGTAGGYSGEEAINAEFDLLKANTEYAILGYLVDTECACVRYRGVETGNLGIGGPGDELGRDITQDWFIRLSNAFGLPLVPVFNSANKTLLLIDGAQDENGADVTVTTILAQLG